MCSVSDSFSLADCVVCCDAGAAPLLAVNSGAASRWAVSRSPRPPSPVLCSLSRALWRPPLAAAAAAAPSRVFCEGCGGAPRCGRRRLSVDSQSLCAPTPAAIRLLVVPPPCVAPDRDCRRAPLAPGDRRSRAHRCTTNQWGHRRSPVGRQAGRRGGTAGRRTCGEGRRRRAAGGAEPGMD